MPVDLRTDQGGNREVLGYLSLPSGTTTDDPTDAIVKVADFPVSANGTVPIWGTSTSPQLFGVGFGTRTSPAGRWLPAPPELVSPDGRHYAYRHANGTLRLAAVDGSELPVANPNDLAPLAYTSSGVILAQNGPAANGLWLLDPTTQAVTVIAPPSGTDDWRVVSGLMAFGVDSPGALGAPPPTVVMESSLLAGSTPHPVYTAAPGNVISLIAGDGQGGVLIVVTGSSSAQLIYLSPSGPPPSLEPVPDGLVLSTIGPSHHADSHGIWFIGPTGIFLFNHSANLPMKRIAAGVASDVAPGGDCT
jgi:hypothetical protein